MRFARALSVMIGLSLVMGMGLSAGAQQSYPGSGRPVMIEVGPPGSGSAPLHWRQAWALPPVAVIEFYPAVRPAPPVDDLQGLIQRQRIRNLGEGIARYRALHPDE